mgnify:CR=1 FL=1
MKQKDKYIINFVVIFRFCKLFEEMKGIMKKWKEFLFLLFYID